jgi:hypothetical protein
MRGLSLFALALSSMMLSGCLVRSAADIVTAPVKVVGAGVDAATTSQSEADEKRGRDLRKTEEELGKLNRRYENQLKDCREGNDRACFQARETYSEIQILLRNNPALAGRTSVAD